MGQNSLQLQNNSISYGGRVGDWRHILRLRQRHSYISSRRCRVMPPAGEFNYFDWQHGLDRNRQSGRQLYHQTRKLQHRLATHVYVSTVYYSVSPNSCIVWQSGACGRGGYSVTSKQPTACVRASVAMSMHVMLQTLQQICVNCCLAEKRMSFLTKYSLNSIWQRIRWSLISPISQVITSL